LTKFVISIKLTS